MQSNVDLNLVLAIDASGSVDDDRFDLQKKGYAQAFTSQRVLDAIRAIGPEDFFVASDSGLVGTPNHADALVMAARVLRENGYDERALDVMFKENPARLLGLPIR